jgi:hypothetical protein
VRFPDPAQVQFQCRHRAPERAAHPDVIAGNRPGTAQDRLRPRKPGQLGRNRQRAAHEIPADDVDTMPGSEFSKTGGETSQPAFIRPGQGNRQHRPGGLRAHGREIAEVHRQQPAADVGGGQVRREVPARHEGVQGEDQRTPLRRTHEGGVVTGPEQHIGTASAEPGKMPLDQIELAGDAGRTRIPGGIGHQPLPERCQRG